MSVQIDEHVVSMEFDNARFERNVATTMSTLDKFKQKLNLSGASEGLDNINESAKRLDLSSIGRSAETVGLKFNAMYTIADQVLRNITTRVQHTAETMVSALTLDPIKTGLSEYETKINAIQVIKSNTRGKNTMADIEEALAELNTYADRTIYNFAQMTDNVGKFVAQGLDVHQAARAVQGMANLAGASGASASDMARATYQMSQALGGVIRKIDWNSLRIANMASVELKNVLTDLARVKGIDIDSMIESKGTFEDTLEKGWLTGEMFTEAMNIYSDVYSEAELKAKGFTDEQIANFKDLAKQAAEATTEVKTFTQLWDVLKETAQSGWTQSWELIIGDFESAKKNLTALQNYISGFLNKTAEARNRVLEIAFNFTKPWTTIQNKLNNVRSAVDKLGEFTDKLEYFQDVVHRVWMGDFNNVGDDPDRYDLLTQAGYDPRVVQDLVNKGYQYKLTVDDIKASHEKFGLTVETTEKEIESLGKAFIELSDEKLKDAGLTEEEITLYRALEKEADRLGVSVGDLLDEMSKTSGRDLLVGAIKDLGNVLEGVGTAAATAWNEIINPPSLEETGIRIYGVIRSIKDFTETLRLIDPETGKLTDAGLKIQSVFAGIFAVVDIVATILAGPLKIALSIAGQVMSFLGVSLLDVAAAIGDAIVVFHDWFESLFDISGILEVVIPWIESASTAISDWFNTFKQSDGVRDTVVYMHGLLFSIKDWWSDFTSKAMDPKELAEGIADAIMSIPTILHTVFSNLKNAFTGTFDGFGESPFKGIIDSFREDLAFAGDVLSELGKILLNKVNEFLSAHGFKEISLDAVAGLVEGFKNGASMVWDAAIKMVGQLVERVKEFLGIHSPSTVFAAIGGFLVAGLIVGLQNGFPEVFETIKTAFFNIIDWIKNLEFGNILAGALAIGTIATVWKGFNVLEKFSSPFEKLGDMLESVTNLVNTFTEGVSQVLEGTSAVLKSVSLDLKAQALLKMAAAIGILVVAILAMTLLVDDPLMLWNAVAVIAVLAGVLIGLSWALSKLSDASVEIDGKSKKLNAKGLQTTMIQIGLALMAIAFAVKIVGELSPEQATQGLLSLGAIAIGLVAFIAILGGISKYSGDFSGFGATMVKMAIAVGVMALVIKMISDIKTTDLVIGIAAIELFALICIQMGLANRFAGQTGNGSTFLKMAITMALMVLVTKMAASMDVDELLTGVAAMQAFILLVAELALLNRFAGNQVSNVGSTVMKMAGAMMILTGVVWMLSWMDADAVKKGVSLMQLFMLLIAEMIVVGKLAGEKMAKIAGNLIAMSLAVAILAGTAMLLGFIDDKSLMKGITAVTTLCLGMSAMMWAARGVNDFKDTVIAMATAIGVMAVAAIALSFVDTKKLAGAVIAMDALMLGFATMLAVTPKTKNTKHLRKTLWTMVGVVAILAGVIAALSFCDPSKAVPNTVALGTLMITLMASLHILKGVKLSSTVTKNLQCIMLVVFEMAVILGAMSLLPNPERAIVAAVAIGVLLNALAMSMATLSTTKSNYKMTIGQIQTMALVILEVAAILSAMSFLPNPTNMIPSAIAIGILLNTLSSAILVMSRAKGNFKVAFVQLQSMALVITEVAAILAAMSFLPNPWNLIPAAIAIGILLNTLASAMLVMSLAKTNFKMNFVQLQSMALVVTEVAAILSLMSFLPSTDGMLETAVSISTLLLALSAACLIVSVIPAGAGATGAMALLEFVSILTGLVVVLGLLSQIHGFNDLLMGGIETIGLIGSAVGAFVGGIVGGIGLGVATVLPAIGDYLSSFANNAKDFFSIVGGIGWELLGGVAIITAAIILLAGASFINGILTIASLGLGSLTRLGTELKGFGEGAKEFASSISGIDGSAVEAARNISGMILELSAASFLDALTSLFGGTVDYAKLGENLTTFGAAVVKFSGMISGKVDVAAIEAAANAGELLATLQKSLPRSGGLIQDIFGEHDFGAFAKACGDYADAIIAINEKLGNEEFVLETEKFKALTDAGQYFSDLANSIPRSDGFVQDWIGKQDLTEFATAVDNFTETMLTVNEALSQEGLEVESSKFKAIAESGKHFSTLANDIPKSEGFLQEWIGKSDLSAFGDAVKNFAECLIGVNEVVSADNFEVDLDAIADLKTAGEKMNELQDTLPVDGGWWQDVVGSKDIGDFGNSINTFATALVDFGTSGASLDTEGVSTALTTAEQIRTLVESLVGVDTSGVADFTGVGVGGFGADGAAYSIAKAMSKFSDEVANIDTARVSVAADAAEKLKDIIENLSDVDSGAAENFQIDVIGVRIASFAERIIDIDTAKLNGSITAADRLAKFVDGLKSVSVGGIQNFVIAPIASSLRHYYLSTNRIDNELVIESVHSAERLLAFVKSTNGVTADGTKSFAEAMNNLASISVSDFISSFEGISGKLSTIGTTFVGEIVNGIRSAMPHLATAGMVITTMFGKSVTSRATLFESVGEQFMKKLVSGIRNETGDVGKTLIVHVESMIAALMLKYTAFYNAGSYLVTGFANGISANAYRAVAKAVIMANMVEQAARNALGINSPSKVFQDIGAGIPEGFAMGINTLGSTVDESVSSMASTAIDSARSTMGSILDALSGEMEAQPTIRPVIDLSDVKTGIGAISGMFDGVQGVGVQTNIGAITTMMNRNGQNGRNADVVSALDKLNRKMDNIGNTTYQINGVTYDDGSNIASAVQTITRAALRERRV